MAERICLQGLEDLSVVDGEEARGTVAHNDALHFAKVYVDQRPQGVVNDCLDNEGVRVIQCAWRTVDHGTLIDLLSRMLRQNTHPHSEWGA